MPGRWSSRRVLAVCLGGLLIGSLPAPAQDDPGPPRIPRKNFARAPAYPVIAIEPGGGIVVRIDGVETRLRLVGVDARPQESADLHASGLTGRADPLTDFLEHLLRGESVYVEYEGDAPRPDRWGRVPARVYRAPEGTWINLEVVRAGCAALDDNRECRHRDVLEYYEALARKAAKGVWAAQKVADHAPALRTSGARAGGGGEPRDPSTPATGDSAGPSGGKSDGAKPPADAQATVYVTKYGQKYHRADCRFLTDTRSQMSLAEARSKGRTPCLVCKPPE